MKKRFLIVLPMVFVLSCGQAIRDFKDETIRKMIINAEQEKDNTISSTHNYFLSFYHGFQNKSLSQIGSYGLDFYISTTPKDEYYQRMKLTEPKLQIYFSYDDNYLEYRHSYGYAIVCKDGDNYTYSGNFFDGKEELGYSLNELAASLYLEHESEKIYSFEFLDIVKRTFMLDSVDNIDVAFDDFNIYENVYCMGVDNNDIYHFGINKEARITIRDPISESHTTYFYLDFAFSQNKKAYVLKYSGHETLSSLMLTDMSYNVDLNTCFTL